MIKNFGNPLFHLAISSEFIASLPYFKSKVDHATSLFNIIFNFLESIIDDHLKANDYTSDMEPQDFIDAYLLEVEKSDEKGYFSKKQLVNIAFDLWFAGELLWILSLFDNDKIDNEEWLVLGQVSFFWIGLKFSFPSFKSFKSPSLQETTSSTLTWAFAYLIKNQDVQTKMHDEMDKIIGSDRVITVSDKNQLPYTKRCHCRDPTLCQFGSSGFSTSNNKRRWNWRWIQIEERNYCCSSNQCDADRSKRVQQRKGIWSVTVYWWTRQFQACRGDGPVFDRLVLDIAFVML